MPSRFLNHIGGRWVACRTGQSFANVNPANVDDVVGLFQASAAADVDAAFTAAAAAQPTWAALPAPRRGEYLFRAAEILEPGIDIGPVVDEAQLDTDLAYIDIARNEGATLLRRRSTSTPRAARCT